MRYKHDLAEFIPIADGARLIQERAGLSEDEAREDIVFAVRDSRTVPDGHNLQVRWWRTYRGERSECYASDLPHGFKASLTPDLIDWESSIARRQGLGAQFKVEIEVSRADVCRLWPAPPGAEDRNDGRPEYTPPYVEFMLRATREMGLKSGTRTPKKNIEGWLRDNWLDHLGEPTKRKIERMASSLRHPKDEQGGYLKPNRD